jgi:hypothetical protein
MKFYVFFLSSFPCRPSPLEMCVSFRVLRWSACAVLSLCLLWHRSSSILCGCFLHGAVLMAGNMDLLFRMLSCVFTVVYRMSHEERLTFAEVIVSVILNKNVCLYMCRIPNGFRDTAISLYGTLYRRATRHVLTRVAKCIDVDGAVFENVLY